MQQNITICADGNWKLKAKEHNRCRWKVKET